MSESTAADKDIRAVKVAGIILAVALGVGYGGLHATRRAEASRIQVERKRAALEIEIHQLKDLSAAKELQIRPSQALRRASPWNVTAGEGQSPKGLNSWAVAARAAYVIRMKLAAYRAGLGNTYGAFYQSLGLTPAEIEKFEDLMTKHEETILDLDAVTMADDLDGSSPEVAGLREQALEELRAGQRVLLGEAGYGQLQQFNRVEPIQGLVEAVAARTSFPPQPLSETQAQRFAVVVQNASSSYQNGGPANAASIDWGVVLAQAPGLLSASQLHGLELVIDRIKVDQFRGQFFQRERGPR